MNREEKKMISGCEDEMRRWTIGGSRDLGTATHQADQILCRALIRLGGAELVSLYGRVSKSYLDLPKVQGDKKIGTGWLAIGESGEWSLLAYSLARNNDSLDGDAAESAVEGVDEQVYSLHKVTFELPDPPKVQGKGVAVTVGKAV